MYIFLSYLWIIPFDVNNINEVMDDELRTKKAPWITIFGRESRHPDGETKK